MNAHLNYLVVCLIALLLAGSSHAQEIQPSDKIAMLTGTNLGIWEWSPSGYQRLVATELDKAGVKNPWIRITGKNTTQIREALEEEIISKRPKIAVLMPGNKDFNPWKSEVVETSYTENLTAIVAKLQTAGIPVILVTRDANPADQSNSINQNVVKHNAFIRDLARTQNCALIDLVQLVDEAPKPIPFDGNLAAKALVNHELAAAILKQIGYSNAQIAACREEWMTQPNAIQFKPSVSNNTYDQLKSKAQTADMEVGAYITSVLDQAAEERAKP